MRYFGNGARNSRFFLIPETMPLATFKYQQYVQDSNGKQQFVTVVKQSEMNKVNFICLLTLAQFVTSTFSQKRQGYRNKYNPINCGREKLTIFMDFKKKVPDQTVATIVLHQFKFLQSSRCKISGVLSLSQNERT